MPLSAVPIPTSHDPLRAARPYREQVLAMTREIFSGEATVEEIEDCEVAGDWYFVLHVTDGGEIENVCARDRNWHQRLSELPVDAGGMYCLSIAPLEK